MKRFTAEEKKELRKRGFEPYNEEFVYGGYDSTFTVIKDDDDVFEFHADFHAGEDELDYDILRANNNKSLYGLLWDELLEELKGVE